MRISQNLPAKQQPLQGENTKSQNYRASFKGGLDTVIINTMDAIERGGLFASFTIQDMLGTNLPRPITGLTRNKKENNGKTNKTFALKELIREMTTGPSMFLIPMTILNVSSKAVGKALNVPAHFINGLGGIFKETAANAENIADAAVLKKKYYTNVFKNMLENSIDTGSKEGSEKISRLAKEFAEEFISLEGKPKKSVIDNMRGKRIEGSLQDAVNDFADKFTDVVKAHSADSTSDFLTAKIKNADGEVIGTSFKKLLNYISDYGDDAIKTTMKSPAESGAKNAVKNFVSNFNIKRINTRFALNIGMIGAIIAFLTCIPKLYNISKENPALAGLEDNTANTAVNQTKKGEA